MKKRKMYFRMITASLIRRRSRMVVALLAVAIGATILSGLVTIYHDVPRQMGAQFRNYGANMIFAATDGPMQQEDVKKAAAMIPEDQLVGIAPFRYETVRIHETPVVCAGTDLEGVRATSPYWSIEGEWPANPEEILIGEEVASNYNLKIGDKVTVSYTPEEAQNASEDEMIPDNMIDFLITGFVETGGNEEDYVYISLEDMKTLTGKDIVIDLAELSVSASQDVLTGYTEKINKAFPSISARLVKRVTASETTVLTKLQALVLLVTIVVLALTMICVATTMTAVVTERRKEIGLRKALGASNESIIAEFMGEGLLLGGVGGILGSFLGFAFAQAVSSSVFNSSIVFQPYIVPLTIIASVLVTGLACILPIRSATDVDPALVLKGE